MVQMRLLHFFTSHKLICYLSKTTSCYPESLIILYTVALGSIPMFLVIKDINVIPVLIPKYQNTTYNNFLSIIVFFEIMVEFQLVKKKGMTRHFPSSKKVAVKIYVDFAKIRLSLEALTLQICLVTQKIIVLRKYIHGCKQSAYIKKKGYKFIPQQYIHNYVYLHLLYLCTHRSEQSRVSEGNVRVETSF